MCQGELFPVDKKSGSDDSLKKLQCTECHRVITMRFCSSCGHQFRDEKVDARMEIPGVNVALSEGFEVGGDAETHRGAVQAVAFLGDDEGLRAAAEPFLVFV